MSNDLPILLVSAADKESAEEIITELVGSDREEVEGESGATVWLLSNKYYEARVRVIGRGDEDGKDGSEAEAHLIVLGPEEGEVALARRAAAAPHAEVRLALARCEEAAEALLACALRRHYELLPLLAPPDPPEPPPMQRARDALHAHAWPGLRRHRPGVTGEPEEDPLPDDGESFSAALRLLDAARALPPEERRARAVLLFTALCDALNLEPDEL